MSYPGYSSIFTRDNNGDDAIVIIKDPPGENYKWIGNQSSSELQKFWFFFPFLT